MYVTYTKPTSPSSFRLNSKCDVTLSFTPPKCQATFYNKNSYHCTAWQKKCGQKNKIYGGHVKSLPFWSMNYQCLSMQNNMQLNNSDVCRTQTSCSGCSFSSQGLSYCTCQLRITTDSVWCSQNRSCSKPLFQSEAKCKVTDMRVSFDSHPINSRFHKKGSTPASIWKYEFLELGNGLSRFKYIQDIYLHWTHDHIVH